MLFMYFYACLNIIYFYIEISQNSISYDQEICLVSLSDNTSKPTLTDQVYQS